MDPSQLDPLSSSSPGFTKSSPWPWLFASLIVVLALSLAAAHAPPRIRLIGLFSIAFGLLVGLVLRELANKLEAALSTYWIGVCSALFTIAGLVLSTSEIVRLEAAKQPKSPKDAAALRMIEELERPSHNAASSEFQTTRFDELRQHLAFRIRQLGFWPTPWPETFWVLELVSAATASFWIANRHKKRAKTSGNG